MSDYLFMPSEEIMKTYSNDNFRLHNHSEYEIYMFLEGDCKYVVEEKNYELSHGDIIIIRKHEMHRVFHNSITSSYRRIVIMVSPLFFVQNNCAEYEDAFLTNALGNRINSEVVRSSGLYDAIMRLKKYTDNFSSADTPVATSIITEILYLINHITMFEKAETSNKTIKNIITYINNHFTEEITLNMLCDKFYLSKYYLCRLFKEATGLTIQQYIKQRRLTLVSELKKEGKSLTEAALASGFCDYSSFYRAYVKKYNKNPSGDI